MSNLMPWRTDIYNKALQDKDAVPRTYDKFLKLSVGCGGNLTVATTTTVMLGWQWSGLAALDVDIRVS